MSADADGHPFPGRTDHAAGHEDVAVVAQPPRRVSRGRRIVTAFVGLVVAGAAVSGLFVMRDDNPTARRAAPVGSDASGDSKAQATSTPVLVPVPVSVDPATGSAGALEDQYYDSPLAHPEVTFDPPRAVGGETVVMRVTGLREYAGSTVMPTWFARVPGEYAVRGVGEGRIDKAGVLAMKLFMPGSLGRWHAVELGRLELYATIRQGAQDLHARPLFVTSVEIVKADVGADYEHSVNAYCGVVSTWFDGRLWLADPSLFGTDPAHPLHPPAGWNERETPGMLTLESPTRASFVSDTGMRASFVEAPPGAVDPLDPFGECHKKEPGWGREGFHAN